MQEIVHQFISNLHQRIGFDIAIPEPDESKIDLISDPKLHRSVSLYWIEVLCRIKNIFSIDKYFEHDSWSKRYIIVVHTHLYMSKIIWL